MALKIGNLELVREAERRLREQTPESGEVVRVDGDTYRYGFNTIILDRKGGWVFQLFEGGLYQFISDEWNVEGRQDHLGGFLFGANWQRYAEEIKPKSAWEIIRENAQRYG